MKLLVIVICLFCERFLTHASAHERFKWFGVYSKKISHYLDGKPTWLVLSFMVLPLPFAALSVLFISGGWVFGFVGLLLNVIIFYYCLGPENPFYPKTGDEPLNDSVLARYFISANEQLFAVMICYIIFGIFGALFYRLLTLCKEVKSVQALANKWVDLMEWVPARVTSFTYLLVGNFQSGISSFFKSFLTSPSYNSNVLRETGMIAVNRDADKRVQLIDAERQVEHALILQLTLLAIGTMVVWF